MVQNTPSELRVFREQEGTCCCGCPVRIEGEALTGKGRADVRTVVVSRAEPGNAPVQEGEGSNQVVLQSVPGRRASGGHSQFAVDRAHVEIDGDHTDDELFGNLSAGQALCKQA